MMKKCIVVSTPEARFSALAIREDFSSSLRKVAELGFDAVELALRDPERIDISGLKALLRVYRLPVPALGTGQAYGEEGLSLTDPDREVRRKAIERLKAHMDLAVQLDGSMVIVGLIRGTVRPGSDPREAEQWLWSGLSECLDYRPDILLLFEPLNRYETNLYNDTASAKELIDRMGRPNLKMLVDTFHMNIEEPNIVESILRLEDTIAHVHFADSNRWAPGCGHLNFAEILMALRKINYRGAISAEILPKPSSEESMKLTIETYRRLGL